MSDDSGNSISDNSSENQSFDEYIKIKKSHSKTVTFSRKLSCTSQTFLREINTAEVTLLEIQNDENKEFDNFLKLWKEIENIEQIFQQFIQYIDCVKLQMKTTNQLSIFLNNLTLRENILTENLSQSLKELCQEKNLDTWNDTNSEIYNFLENFSTLNELKRKFDDDKNKYEVALKNFKIVLEFMNINLKDLEKLKKQFEQVLWNYQHSRCLLLRNMMEIKENGIQFLGKMCESLGIQNDDNTALSSRLSYLLGNLGNAFNSDRKFTRNLYKNELINKIK